MMLAAKVQKTSEMYSFYEQNTRASKAAPRGSPRDKFRYDLFITFKDATLTEELWGYQAEKYRAAFPQDDYNKWAALKKSVLKLLEAWKGLNQEEREDMSASVHSANGSSFAVPCFGATPEPDLPPTQTLEQLLGKRPRGRPPKSSKSATIPNKRVKVDEEEVKDDLTDLSHASDWTSKVPNKTGEKIQTMSAFKKQLSSNSGTMFLNPRKLAAPISEKKQAKIAQKEASFNNEDYQALKDKCTIQALEIRHLKWNMEETQEKLRAETQRNAFLAEKVGEIDQKLDAMHKVFWAQYTVAGTPSRDLRMPLGGTQFYQHPVDGEYRPLAKYGSVARAAQERAKIVEEVKEIIARPHKKDLKENKV